MDQSAQRPRDSDRDRDRDWVGIRPRDRAMVGARPEDRVRDKVVFEVYSGHLDSLPFWVQKHSRKGKAFFPIVPLE